MRRARRFFAKCRTLLFRKRAEADLAREVASHLALIEDEFLKRGMDQQEARLAARRAWGGVEQSKELQRDERTFVAIEQVFQDVRHAFRSLANSPGFTSVALLSLACGIGVNTAVFTLANGILLKELLVRDPHRIVQVTARVAGFTSNGVGYPAYRELRRQRSVFADLIGFWVIPVQLDSDGNPARAELEMVTGSYFAFFEARPALGRLLDEEDDRVEGSPAVCVLSYRTWLTRFGGDTSIPGRTVHINGVPFQVAGVAAPGFIGPELQRQADLWAPTAAKSAVFEASREDAHWIWIKLLGRLRSGVSLVEARARLAGASRGIEEALPKDTANRDSVYELHDASKGFDRWRSTLQDPLLVLLTAVALVLLIACANVANLMLARGNERRQEFSIKLAMGSSRWRLLRQLLIEIMLLTAGGGVAGIFASFALTRFLLDLFNTGNDYVALHVAPDRSAWLFTFAACVVAVLISGLYPAWRASGTGVAASLRPVSASPGPGLVRRILIAVQVTLAVVLLFGATLFTHSLRNLKTIPLGYDIDRLLTVDVGLRGPLKRNAVRSTAPLDEVIARVRHLPAVKAAALAAPGLLSGTMMACQITARDSSGTLRNIDNVHFLSAGPGYLATMQVPLLRGREFTAADQSRASITVVNQRLASMLWPGENPVGKSLTYENDKLEVIGLAGNTKYADIREDLKPMMFSQFDAKQNANVTLAIRCRGRCEAVEKDVRTIVHTAAPEYTVSRVSTMDRLRDGNISLDRLLTFLCNLFGVLGTALALVGIYGLVSYSVTRRTREVGIRVSIGAQRGDILWLLIRETLALMSAGVLIGLPLALLLAVFVRKMLFDLTPRDPIAIAATLGLIVLGGTVAAAVPAVKATRVNPVEALRYD